MVSSGTVSGDLSSVESGFSSYSSATSGLGSSWQGPSFDSLSGKMDDFIGEFKAAISGEMNAFADACDAYEKYIQALKNQKDAEANVAEAIRVKDASAQSEWEGQVTNFKQQKEDAAEQIRAALIAASSTKLDATALSGSSVSGSTGAKLGTAAGAANGEKYWQVQQNGENCGMTAFMVAVNTALGENKYTNNAEEWANYGCYSEAIGFSGCDQAQTWINDHGLSDKIEVTGIQNVNSKEELYEHLNRGEVVVSSSGGANIFNRNDGSYENYGGHYITFYKTENGNVYANDSSVGDPSLASGVEYTPEDLDNWFAAPGNHGSITVARK